MPPLCVGFWVQNSLNKGPFFGRCSLNIGRFSINLKKWSKMVSIPPKFIIKVGMTETIGS